MYKVQKMGYIIPGSSGQRFIEKGVRIILRNRIRGRYMNTITLDFSGIRSDWELHEYFKEIFQPPDFYGHNMDALWDCLYCCYDRSTAFVLKNLSAIPRELTPEIEDMLHLFRDLMRKDGVRIVIDDTEASDYLI